MRKKKRQGGEETFTAHLWGTGCAASAHTDVTQNPKWVNRVSLRLREEESRIAVAGSQGNGSDDLQPSAAHKNSIQSAI